MKDTRLIGLIAALALLFASCDRKEELLNTELLDGFATVRIRSLSVAENGSESLVRAFSQQEQKTITSPIGDGMLLEMSIKQNDSPLRDKVKTLLGEGKKFRVIAVNQEDGTYHSHGDFTVGESGPSNDFHVRIGKKYDYICISYNSETDLPPNDYEDGEVPDEVDIDNANDILWCKINDTQEVPASPAVVELDILLAQKLAKVSVTIDCDYNKWKISIGEDMVSIGDVAVSGTLDLSSGNITSDTPAPQTFASFTSDDDASISQTSNELRVIPKTNGPITITVLAAAVSREDLSNIPTSNKTATLTTPLEAGSNYVITVRLRIPIFARSNIYWDDTAKKLTFVPAVDPPATNNDTKQGYQGVFFKFGSLVGISPIGAISPVPVYEAGNATPYTTTWAAIPYEKTTLDVGDPDIATLKGDICKYINSSYRLPVPGEFGPSDGWDQQGWEKYENSSFGAVTSDKADGTYDFIANGASCAKNTVMGNVVFPASGYRGSNWMGGAGVSGIFRYGLAEDADASYGLLFNTNDVNVAALPDRDYSYPVRCVKN